MKNRSKAVKNYWNPVIEHDDQGALEDRERFVRRVAAEIFARYVTIAPELPGGAADGIFEEAVAEVAIKMADTLATVLERRK